MVWPYCSLKILWISRKTERLFKAAYAEADLNIIDSYILMDLLGFDGECGQDELVKIYHLNKSTISTQLASLNRKGMVECSTDPNYRNRNRVKLLPLGVEIARKCFEMCENWEEVISGHYTAEEQQEFLRYLKIFEENTRAIDEGRYRPKNELSPPFVFYFTFLAKRLEAIRRMDSGKMDLEPSQRSILYAIAFCGDMTPYKELEEFLQFTQSCIVKQIQKLEKAEYVQSFVDQVDRRVKRVKLTTKGKSEIQLLNDRIEEFEEEGLKRMYPKERERFFFYLLRICEELRTF